jgi:hypothetical protein
VSATIAPPLAQSAAQVGARPRWHDAGLAMSLGLGSVYVAVGAWVSLVQGVFIGDALSRTSMAMNVVLSRDPHLGAIGFVWNPLPALLQVPLVAVLTPFGLAYLAGPIMSAAFSAGTLWLLDRLLLLFELGPRRRLLLLGVYALNPLIVWYAVNGMSEAAFIFFLVGATYHYLRWTRGAGYPALISFALLSSGAFLVRYEAVALALAAIPALVLAFWAAGRLEPDRLEAVLLTFFTPVAYCVGVWVFFNWLFMGDPLYFQHGEYSNQAQTQSFRTDGSYLAGIVGSPGGALRYALERWGLLFPLGPVVVVLAVIRVVVRRDLTLLSLVLIALCVPLFHLFLLYSGSSFGWLRFFMYGLPFGIVLTGAVLRATGQERFVWACAGALLLLSLPTSLFAMRQPELGREEWQITQHLLDPATAPAPPGSTFRAERQIAAAVDAAPDGTTVLMDSYDAFPVSVFSRHPSRLAVPSDRDFKTVLGAPWRSVSHVLVPRPECEPKSPCPPQSDAVVTSYPSLWGSGEPWLELAGDFGGDYGWRLYRVVPGVVA